MIVLTKRERMLGLGLAAVLGVSTLYAVVIRPTSYRIETLERIIPEKQSELHALEAKSVEYTALCKGFEDFRAKMAAQDPNFELLPYIETLLDKHGLTKMAPDVRPLQSGYSETVVKIELDGVSMKQLLGFLKEIESSQACVQIGSWRIHQNPTDNTLLDSTIEIRGPQPGQDPIALNVEAHS
jgi:type II secretory pathway component PulM